MHCFIGKKFPSSYIVIIHNTSIKSVIEYGRAKNTGDEDNVNFSRNYVNTCKLRIYIASISSQYLSSRTIYHLGDIKASLSKIHR